MKFICNDCGRLLDEEDLEYEATPMYEYVDKGCCTVPYFVGYEPIDEENLSCTCGGDLIPAEICEVCGDYKVIKYTDEGYSICEDCVAKYKTTELALRVGQYRNQKVNINEYIASVLTEEEINKVLFEYIKDISPLISCKATEYLNKPVNEEHFKEELFEFLEEEQENQNNI